MTTTYEFTREQFDALRNLTLTQGKASYDEENQGDAENGPEAPDYQGHKLGSMTAHQDDDNVIVIEKSETETILIIHPASDKEVVEIFQQEAPVC